MPDTIQHAYECTAKGHANGTRAFLAAPPIWFADKGMPEPKNCPDCRDWISAQRDDTKICVCGDRTIIYAQRKIYHFKKVGPLPNPILCLSCENGRKPRSKIAPIKNVKTLDETKYKLKQPEFDSLDHGLSVESRALVISMAHYITEITGDETRYEHIGRHVQGCEFDATTDEGSEAFGVRKKSPTLFGTGSVEDVIETASQYMYSNSDGQVRDYQDGRNVVRITFTGDHDHLELTVLRPVQNTSYYSMITTYDNMAVSDVLDEDFYKNRISNA